MIHYEIPAGVFAILISSYIIFWYLKDTTETTITNEEAVFMNTNINARVDTNTERNRNITPIAFNTNIVNTVPMPDFLSTQDPTKLVKFEGHWLGMEVMDITPALAKEFGVFGNQPGVIVDEITLFSASTGLLAGDIITDINGFSITNLEDFFAVTKKIRDKRKIRLSIIRYNRNYTINFKANERVGVAQMEGAQPIRPGAISPHAQRNRPCTDCHIIMKNQSQGQLPTDAGDARPVPPLIKAGSFPPPWHGNRGQCNTCHVVMK